MHPSMPLRLGAALDALLRALDLEQLDEGRFRAPPDTVRELGRVYGGQLLAQALVAAGHTVTGKAPRSLHAAFVKAGTPGHPLELVVDRVRDGRSLSTRQVTVAEQGTPLLTALVSFHGGSAEPQVAAPAPPAPPAPPPEDVPLLQHWAEELPAELRHHGRHWVEQPPPVEMRMGEPPTFLGFLGPPSTSTTTSTTTSATRSHWMRLPRDIGDDPLLHAALLAYASDFLLMDMVFRAHPGPAGPGRSNGLSLDHAIWFHRPVRFEGWHLHTQEALAVAGDRGLARGAIHDADGRLAATVMQEVLVVPVGRP